VAMTEDTEILFPENQINNQKLSYMQLILNLYFSPTKSFQSLKIKAHWLIPLILLIVVSFTNQYFTNKYRMEDLKERIKSNQSLTGEDIQRRINNIESQKSEHLSWRMLGYALGVVSALQIAKIFSLALVFWLSLHFYVISARYMTLVSISGIISLLSIPQSIIKIPLILLKGTTNVYLGIAAFLPNEWYGSPLFNLAKEIDIFGIWQIILWIMALQIVINLSRKRAVCIVCYLWAIWLIISMLLGSLIQIL
jgi:hypothetical protein